MNRPSSLESVSGCTTVPGATEFIAVARHSSLYIKNLLFGWLVGWLVFLTRNFTFQATNLHQSNHPLVSKQRP
jgi:hypothetical protein